MHNVVSVIVLTLEELLILDQSVYCFVFLPIFTILFKLFKVTMLSDFFFMFLLSFYW